VSFQEAVRTVLQRKYATFSGRARRSEFWFFVLFSAIVRTIANVLDAIIHSGNSTRGGVISAIVALLLLIPSLAVSVRRLHDTDRSGWWLFIALIPIVGIIILVVWWAHDSGPENQYGPNPKGYDVPAYAGSGYGQGYAEPPYPPQPYAPPTQPSAAPPPGYETQPPGYGTQPPPPGYGTQPPPPGYGTQSAAPEYGTQPTAPPQGNPPPDGVPDPENRPPSDPRQ
jgi:uncharacterized membrane protein YhaH (DUF805 family)